MSTTPREHGSRAVQNEWLRRVEAEYRSAALTQHLTLWLIQMAASPDLIDLGIAIVQDELAHASLSHEVFTAAGGARAPMMARETLALPRSREPLEFDVLRACLETFCLGETIAVPLFKELRQGCTVPIARRALDRILRDEVRHRDFGWTLLTWLLDTPLGPALGELVDRELPSAFSRLKRSYAPEGARNLSTIPEGDRAWGLTAPARYVELLEHALERDYRPRFQALGIDCSSAWSARVTA